MKTCIYCRQQVQEWKKNNKTQVKLYNKHHHETQKRQQKTRRIVCARKKCTTDPWQEFPSQAAAARALGAHTSNISHVLKGKLRSTGGYEFKVINREVEPAHSDQSKNWDQIKQENGIENQCKGKPSKRRVLHETIDGVEGKNCCTCKQWKPLDEYNYASSHWDRLRNDCKQCLVAYRLANRAQIQKTNNDYATRRKKVDPAFKLACTLRSRLGNAIEAVKRRTGKPVKKSDSTIKLTGCTIEYLMECLELQFQEGMTWQNHGEWHVDHIRPCCSFDLTKPEEQAKCFHHSNLQPLWASDNTTKGGKWDTNTKPTKPVKPARPVKSTETKKPTKPTRHSNRPSGLDNPGERSKLQEILDQHAECEKQLSDISNQLKLILSDRTQMALMTHADSS